MSTHTVYGCYIASTGKFEFNDTVCEEATITGCLVKEGDHTGQIEITHDYGGCETQYYACYDPATGKFEFDADDGCCESACESCTVTPPTSNECDFCGNENVSKYMLMSFSGFTGGGAGLNGESIILHCIANTDYYCWYNLATINGYQAIVYLYTNNEESKAYVYYRSDVRMNNATDTDQKCACSGTIIDGGGQTVTWEPCDASGNTPCPCDFDIFYLVTIEGVVDCAEVYEECPNYSGEGYWGPGNCQWVNDAFILGALEKGGHIWQWSDGYKYVQMDFALPSGEYPYTPGTYLKAYWDPPEHGDPENPSEPWCSETSGLYAYCFGVGFLGQSCTTEGNDEPSWNQGDYCYLSWGGYGGTASWEQL